MEKPLLVPVGNPRSPVFKPGLKIDLSFFFIYMAMLLHGLYIYIYENDSIHLGVRTPAPIHRPSIQPAIYPIEPPLTGIAALAR